MSSTRYEMDVFCNAMSLVPHDAGSLGVVVDEVFSDGKSEGADRLGITAILTVGKP